MMMRMRMDYEIARAPECMCLIMYVHISKFSSSLGCWLYRSRTHYLGKPVSMYLAR